MKRIALAIGVGCVVLLCAARVSAQDGSISACAHKVSGAMRYVTDVAECKPSESALEWNVAGPQGVAGPEGPPGPAAPGESHRIPLSLHASSEYATQYYADIPTECLGKNIVIEFIMFQAFSQNDDENGQFDSVILQGYGTGQQSIIGFAAPPPFKYQESFQLSFTAAHHNVTWRLPAGTEQIGCLGYPPVGADRTHVDCFLNGYCIDLPQP